MNLIEKISKGLCSVEELERLLDEQNPTVLYHAMVYIGNEKVSNENVISKLNKLSFKREANDKLLGYYKIGDLSIATLQRIGEDVDKISSYQTLDDFDRKMLNQLSKEIGW
jgi:hypothetical protein